MSLSNSFSSPSFSRPESRTSVRSTRPASPAIILDGPVAVRNQMSTLKHNIRQQQAQLHNLENIILRGPRPLPPGMMNSPPSPDLPELPTQQQPPPPSQVHTTTNNKVQRRTSFDVLHGLAGPDSNLPLPLPRRDGPSTTSMKQDGGIPEGIPVDFSVGATSPSSYKRTSSPTRTLSRIPVSAVGNARALADEGQPATSRPSRSPVSAASTDGDTSLALLNASTSSLQPPPSPNNRRVSLTPGGTTKVLADLQTGVVNARNALENTKAQLRLSQRSVAQLTRQTEDLKEGRERLRLENEGLNNVVARKERLLQEILERARKAESEAAALKTQLKVETTSAKKSLRELETALSESTALSQRSEREYITLRDSIKGMVEGWKTDTEILREEMRKREERWRKEAELVGQKYRKLVEDVKTVQDERGSVNDLRAEDQKISKEFEDGIREELDRLRAEIEKSSQESNEAGETAKSLASELARLRRLLRAGGRSPPSSAVEVGPP